MVPQSIQCRIWPGVVYLQDIENGKQHFRKFILTLVMMARLKILVLIGENNRKSSKIKHCVDLFLSGGCEDRDIFWAFFTNLSIEIIYLSPELREK